jgi:hypothetical protein
MAYSVPPIPPEDTDELEREVERLIRTAQLRTKQWRVGLGAILGALLLLAFALLSRVR